MTTENANLTDVRDMYSVHEAFRRGLRDAPGQLAAAHDGDTERASRLADYLGELLWLLHVHHGSEDELRTHSFVSGLLNTRSSSPGWTPNTSP